MATSSTNPFEFNPFHPWENRVTGGAVIRRADAAGSSTSSKKKKAIVTLTEPLNIKFEAERVLSGGYLADGASSTSTSATKVVGTMRDPLKISLKDMKPISNFCDDDNDSKSTSAKRKKAMATVKDSVNTIFEAERVPSGYMGGVAVQFIIDSPMRLSIIGFKDAGGKKVKEMEVLGQFVPVHLSKEKVKVCIIKECASSTTDYRTVGNFDLTKVKHFEELPYMKLTHPCNFCNLEGSHSGHDGVVQVGIREVFNGLLVRNKKQKYVEYQINCQCRGIPIGSVIFSKLKKPPTRLKRGLSKASEWSRKRVPLLAAVTSLGTSVAKFFV